MDLYKETTKFYENRANEYFEETKDLIDEEQLNKFISSLPDKDFVIDLGCGSGRDLKFLTEAGINAIGIEPSLNMANIAEKYTGADVINTRVQDLNFKTDSVSGIWSRAVLHHLTEDDMITTMNYLYGVLKPEGIFYLSVKEGVGNGLIDIDGYKRYYNFYSKESLTELLKNCHFKIVDMYKTKSLVKRRPNIFINAFIKK